MADKKGNYNFPKNYQSGINIMGSHIATGRFFQGAIIGSILVIAVFFVPVSINAKVPIIVLVGAGGMMIGIVGLNGGTILQFLNTLMIYKSVNDVSYYNPRVKSEFHAISSDIAKTSMVSQSKFSELYGYYNKHVSDKNADTDNMNTGLPDDAYFNDDEGVVEKPEEYMTAGEKKAKQKELKKEESENAKKQKAIKKARKNKGRNRKKR